MQEDLGLREDTYELRYNAACFKLGAKQYEAAIEKLDQAESRRLSIISCLLKRRLLMQSYVVSSMRTTLTPQRRTLTLNLALFGVCVCVCELWNVSFFYFLLILRSVQKAYALQCLGRIKEATELYNQVAKQK